MASSEIRTGWDMRCWSFRRAPSRRPENNVSSRHRNRFHGGLFVAFELLQGRKRRRRAIFRSFERKSGAGLARVGIEPQRQELRRHRAEVEGPSDQLVGWILPVRRAPAASGEVQFNLLLDRV